MNVFHLDYETRSAADLKKYGAYRYACDPSTSIILAAICKDDGPIEIWDYTETKERNAAALELLKEAASDPTALIYAHNAPFEISISAYHWRQTFGFAPPKIEQWRCTAALCRTVAIPSSLEKAAEFLELPAQKDKTGKAMIAKFSVPRKKDGAWYTRSCDAPDREHNPAELASEKAWVLFRKYCQQDVEVERQIHKRLATLELKGWILDSFLMDLRMNHRGVPINVAGVVEAEKLVNAYNERVGEEFTEMTGLFHTQGVRCLEWLQAEGYPGENLQASTVAQVLTGKVIDDDGEDTGERVQPGWIKMSERGVRALKMKSLLSFAALKKLPAMRGAACPDDRVRGILMWHGAARTGRHSSRVLQIQNMRRPTVKHTEQIYAEICSGKIDALDLEIEHGPPLECVASSIRHFIDPGEGKQFIDADFSQIEARVLAWLSGHDALLQAFRDGKDLYKQTAAMTFGVPYEEVDKDLRFLGKVVSLACIAEGQLVLTDEGLVPIEKVALHQRVWDGVEWVSHEGVIFKGIRKVITYQGLTATEDHQVFTDTETVMAFQDAIAGQKTLKVTGDAKTLPPHGQQEHDSVYDIVNAGPRNRFTVSNVLVHNCGYQGGINAFTIMARNYGAEVTPEKAAEVVSAYRKNNPPIVALWKAMQMSAVEAIQNPGRWVPISPLLRFGVTRVLGYPSLVMELPSKRRIQYPKPEVRPVYKIKNHRTGKWSDIPASRAFDADGVKIDGVWATSEVTYAGQLKQSTKWGRVTTHGGVFTENACQAVAGDFLTHGTMLAEKKGYEPCFVVHDQLITHFNPDKGDTVDGLVSELCQLPSWAPNFPLNAVGNLTDFYTKD